MTPQRGPLSTQHLSSRRVSPSSQQPSIREARKSASQCTHQKVRQCSSMPKTVSAHQQTDSKPPRIEAKLRNYAERNKVRFGLRRLVQDARHIGAYRRRSMMFRRRIQNSNQRQQCSRCQLRFSNNQSHQVQGPAVRSSCKTQAIRKRNLSAGRRLLLGAETSRVVVHVMIRRIPKLILVTARRKQAEQRQPEGVEIVW